MENLAHIPSEDVEPPLAATIGLCWRECEHNGCTADALRIFEAQLRALGRFAMCCHAVHAQLVLGNHECQIGTLRRHIDGLKHGVTHGQKETEEKEGFRAESPH